MTHWRPTNWDASKIATQKIPEEGSIAVALVEAGADAMLKALSDFSIIEIHLPALAIGGDSIVIKLPREVKGQFRHGKLIYIPIEENVES